MEDVGEIVLFSIDSIDESSSNFVVFEFIITCQSERQFPYSESTIFIVINKESIVVAVTSRVCL